MINRELVLNKQVQLVFKEMVEELSLISSGTLFMHIRDNNVGKFGLSHTLLEGNEVEKVANHADGLTREQQTQFLHMAIGTLHYRKWTHGEIAFDFSVINEKLVMSARFVSNYNMSNIWNGQRSVNG
ncbi:O-methyltransferase [Longirhabdus pacifica]|uniref:O-methyltransferase n=1 Tax=Longirhabdus pacifica TaxID=2305227 RepID=UPI0010088ADB|nr:O-methyltransferase [Longirhabdus pacifica]